MLGIGDTMGFRRRKRELTDYYSALAKAEEPKRAVTIAIKAKSRTVCVQLTRTFV